MPDERKLNATLRFLLDRQSVEQVKEGAQSVETSLERVEKKLLQVRDTAEKFQQIGQIAAISGAAILAPLTLAANSYVQYAGRADAVSRRWLDSQQRLNQATLRVGRVAATAILPVMEKLAEVTEKAAGFAEQHPGAVKAALGIGGTLAVVGGIVTVAAGALSTVAALKQAVLGILKIAGAGAAAKTAAAAAAAKTAAGAAGAAGAGGAGTAVAGGAAAAGGLTAGGLALTAVGGLVLGGGIYQAIAQSKAGQAQGLANLQQMAAVAAYKLGGLVGGTDTANRWFVKVSGSLGAMDEATQRAAESALGMAQAQQRAGGTTGGRMVSQAAVDTYIAYQREAQRAEETYQEARSETIATYARQRLQMVQGFERQQAKAAVAFARGEQRALEQYQKARGQTLENFHKEEQRAETEYYEQRRKTAEQQGLETARMEEDHQRDMLRLRQDYDLRQEDAVAERDANLYLQNQRGYETDRQRAEQDYQVTAGRRDQDYGRQIAEMESAYAEQREMRRQNLAEQMAEQAENYAEAKDERAAQYREQMDEMAQAHQEQLAEADRAQAEQLSAIERAHAREMADLETGLAEQLAALDENLLGERNLKNAYYAQMTTDLNSWLDRNAAAMRNKMYNTSPAGATSTGVTGTGSYAGWSSTPTYGVIGGRQAGGYAGPGAYNLGESGREFVLNNQATQMAERLLGGGLTQQGLVNRLAHSALDLNIRVDAPTMNDASQAMLLNAFLPMAEEAAGRVFERVMVTIGS